MLNGKRSLPNYIIQAINFGLQREAATFMDSAVTPRNIVTKASHGQASDLDLETVYVCTYVGRYLGNYESF